MSFAAPYAARIASLRELIALYDREVARFEADAQRRLSRHDGYRVIQAIPGVGPVLAAVFVAEIGDVTRFPGPKQLTCWAGLTPRHHESDTVVRRGSITKQGSRLVRWAAVEAVARQRGATKIQVDRRRIAERRGKSVAAVAAARKVLTLVYYGLHDGDIRALRQPKAA